MNKINVPALIIAIVVISLLAIAAIAISYRNVWVILLSLFLSFAIMGYGISLKKRRQ
jgi:hypothetical protein